MTERTMKIAKKRARRNEGEEYMDKGTQRKMESKKNR